MKKSSSGVKLEQPDVSNVDGNGVPPPDSSNTAAPSVLPSPVGSRASSAACVPVSRPSSAAAVAFQQASVAYHEAIMAKRLEVVQQMQASLTETTSVAYQSIAAYSHYLEGRHLTPLSEHTPSFCTASLYQVTSSCNNCGMCAGTGILACHVCSTTYTCCKTSSCDT